VKGSKCRKVRQDTS